MKKFIALAVVACMLVANCLMFTSCGKVSEKDFNKDPVASISDAYSNTMTGFFDDNMQLAQVLAKTKENGSFGVYFESNDLMGGDLTRVGTTVYHNAKDQRSVVDVEAVYSGETLFARGYADKNGIAVGSEAILGNSDVYALNYSTFTEKFKDSYLASLFELDAEAADEIVKIVKEMQNSINTAPETTAEELEALTNQLYSLLDPAVSSEKIPTENGKDTDCVVITTQLYNDNIKKIYNHVIDYSASKSRELTEEARTELDMGIVEFDKAVFVNFIAKTYVSKKTNEIVKFTVNGELSEKTEDGIQGEKIPVDLAVEFTDTLILANFETVNLDDESTVKAKLEIGKEKKKAENIYTVKLDTANGSVSLNQINAKITVADNGDFSVEGDVLEDSDENTRSNVALKGNVKKEAEKITIEITSATYNSVTVSFKLGIVISSADAPAMPENAKDIVELTEGQLVDIVNGVSESALGKLIFQAEFPEKNSKPAA